GGISPGPRIRHDAQMVVENGATACVERRSITNVNIGDALDRAVGPSWRGHDAGRGSRKAARGADRAPRHEMQDLPEVFRSQFDELAQSLAKRMVHN